MWAAAEVGGCVWYGWSAGEIGDLEEIRGLLLLRL